MSDSTTREFVDSNVLVYAHDLSAGPKQRIAADLLASLWQRRTGCLSIQTLQEFVVNVTRRVEKPLSISSATVVVEVLAEWQIHSPQASDVVAAMQRQQDFQISFWDAMILQSASRLGCQVLWSEDLNEGQNYGGVTVCNPFAAANS